MNVIDIARELDRAHQSRVPVPPLTDRVAGLTLEVAYEIQRAWVGLRTERGARVVGHKVGLTSQAMQGQLGVNQPDFGHLLDDMFVPPGNFMTAEGFIQPRIEPEIAFVLERQLAGPTLDVDDVLDATKEVVPALEIIDSRIRKWQIGLYDTVADNASSAAVVVAESGVKPRGIELAEVACRLLQNGEVVHVGHGRDVLGHPAAAVAWLANTLAQFGTVLEPGHVVLPGSLTMAIPVNAGDEVTADFDGIGAVTIRFTNEAPR